MLYSRQESIMRMSYFVWYSSCILSFLIICSEAASQEEILTGLLESRSSHKWVHVDATREQHSPVFVASQDGQMKADKIDVLPGQPDELDFDHYSGYVTVDPQAGKHLFYYFAESPQNSSTKPLVLWLNGGPGCSSFGIGAMTELGPFRVNSDGKTLFRNDYAWNNVANVIFLESPAGVGFSYSSTGYSVYNNTGDTSTAKDAYTFIVNWLERFPHYKSRDFYITGESYAGHYVPQLASAILANNENSNHQTIINLKGIAIGNADIDYQTRAEGFFDQLWTHALISDETINSIHQHCDFSTENANNGCETHIDRAFVEMGNIDVYNIYAPLCLDPKWKNGSTGSVHEYDPCSSYYVESYLNMADVQKALHVNHNIEWSACSGFHWTDRPLTVLPVMKSLMKNAGMRVWLYSGDQDAIVPITSTRYAINSLKLPIKSSWRPWYVNEEVGGYLVAYEGLTLVTVRGAGHLVPTYQPERAISMISSFLQGTLPASK